MGTSALRNLPMNLARQATHTVALVFLASLTTH